MNRRQFLQTAAALPLLGAPKRPNIVLIMADDMGFSDVGCYGGEIQTPNLDALARRGIRFTHFYNTARCCPTRSSLLTGLYPHQTGVGHMMEDRGLPAYRGNLNRNCVTIAEALKPAGYRTLMCGKYHVANDLKNSDNWPRQRGFDRFYGTITGAGSFYWPTTLARDNELIEPETRDFYYTDALSDQAARYIGEEAKRPEPFFLYLAYTAPHWPLHALESDIAKYKGRYKDGWDALRLERHRRQLDMGLVDKRWPLTPRDPRVPAWTDAPNKDWQQRRMEVYAAMVDRLDQGIGRVVARLKETGVFDNTLILFLADNGGCAEELNPRISGAHYRATTRDGRAVRAGNVPSIMPGPDDTYASYGIGWANASNTPFRLYKHWVHEGGISSPLIAHWPGGAKKPGRITHESGHLIDVMATALDLAGAPYPKTNAGQPVTPLEGTSLRPVLENRGPLPPRSLFWEHEGNRAVRQDRWKLVSRHPQQWELYDLTADRTELKDLAAQQPERAASMARAWEQWAGRVGVAPWEQVQKALNQ